MKIIIFGAGSYYQIRKEKLKDFTDIEIIAFADNNVDLWDKTVDDILVIAPNLINTQLYDCILIMSIHYCEIYRQLLELGIEENRILEWDRLCAKYCQKHINIFCLSKKVLIISQKLNYDGGSLCAIYAAMTLKNRGLSVVLAVPEGNSKLMAEVVAAGIVMLTVPTLPYIFETDKKWMNQFDIVLVNLLTMVESAYMINQFCPVLWWIHEVSLVYEAFLKKSIRFVNQNFGDINILAVSNIARNNFNFYVSKEVKKTLMLGIPDRVAAVKVKKKKDDIFKFAIIGTVHKRKAQDVFLKAAFDIKEAAEFWVIGRLFDDEYCHNIKIQSKKAKQVRLLGEVTREELEKLFIDIDVVVCMSEEETLSMAILEGMMYEKICITTENTGIAEYIQDGINGFIVPANDVSALRKKIEWIIANESVTDKMRKAARKTYEENFTMEIFGKNLEAALDETVLIWQANRNG